MEKRLNLFTKLKPFYGRQRIPQMNTRCIQEYGN
jgi:hypothetical protein